MAVLQNITFPVHNTGNSVIYKAYNRQILEVELRAQTLPDGTGFVAEPYPPIIQLTRQFFENDILPPVSPINPDKFVTFFKKEPSAVPFNEVFTFIINLEDAQIKFFEQDDVFDGLDAPSFSNPLSNGFIYGLIIWDSLDFPGRPNPNNLLEPRTDLPVLGFSQLALNARFKVSNDIYLTRFTEPGSRRQLLTNKPLRRVVCLEDSEFLSTILFLNLGNAMKISTFDANGVELDRGIVDLAAVQGGSLGSSVRASVGPANINSFPQGGGAFGTFWFFDFLGIVYPTFTTQPQITSDVAYYEITFGTFNPAFFNLTDAPGANEPTQTYRFYVKQKCCSRRYRVHFVNEYGADDVVTFEDSEIIEYNTSDEFFERNLPSVFTTADRERIQLIKQADEVLTLNKGNLTEEQAFWLKDLLLSPNVLVQKNNGAWVSYALQEGSNTILNRDDDQNQIEITLLRSSIDYSQRN